MSGCLYVVSTPIGNLQDITVRALEVLKQVELIACEDTRVSRKLLSAYEIDTPLTSYHAHSDPAVEARLIDRLVAGDALALISDAGTPLVSDPGVQLVDKAIQAEIPVVPIPGASAALAGLVGSGLVPQPFMFVGFLPRSEGAQREALGPLRALAATLIFYESGRRLAGTLASLHSCLGDRPAAIGRELTKRHEDFQRGRLSELPARYPTPPPGELVILVGPPSADALSEAGGSAEAEARRLVQAGVAPSEAAKTLAGAFGLPKKAAYRLILDASTRNVSG